MRGYEHANNIALDLWEEVYSNKLTLLALTDTFTTKAFFQVRASFPTSPPRIGSAQTPLLVRRCIPVTKDFTADVQRARRWHGLRQDSGDPFVFAPRAKEVYEQLGINPSEKIIVYSDWLNVDKAIALKKQCDELGLNRKFFIKRSLWSRDSSRAQRLSVSELSLRMTSSLCQVEVKRRARRSTS